MTPVIQQNGNGIQRIKAGSYGGWKYDYPYKKIWNKIGIIYSKATNRSWEITCPGPWGNSPRAKISCNPTKSRAYNLRSSEEWPDVVERVRWLARERSDRELTKKLSSELPLAWFNSFKATVRPRPHRRSGRAELIVHSSDRKHSAVAWSNCSRLHDKGLTESGLSSEGLGRVTSDFRGRPRLERRPLSLVLVICETQLSKIIDARFTKQKGK